MRVRVVLPRHLAQRVDVIAWLEWVTPQEVIRCAVARYLEEKAAAHAGGTGVISITWWHEQLEKLRNRGKPREGL